MNDCTIPECGKLPDLRQYDVVVGVKQLRKALLNGRARYVYLAKNADPAITLPIGQLCEEHSVNVCWCASMTELGKACGIDVGASAAAVLEEIRF